MDQIKVIILQGGKTAQEVEGEIRVFEIENYYYHSSFPNRHIYDIKDSIGKSVDKVWVSEGVPCIAEILENNKVKIRYESVKDIL